MTIQCHILDASGALSSHTELLKDLLKNWVSHIGGRRPIRALDICVAHHPEGTNKELGIGGAAHSGIRLDIFLDANNPNLQSSLENEFPAVLAHEMHHCARLAEIPVADTLGECFVIEGLACQFETEITGLPLPSFIPADVGGQFRDYLAASLPILNSTDFDFESWFLGKSPEEMPKYTGFAIGFGLVGDYLKCNQLTAAQAYAVPAADVLANVVRSS